MARSVLRRQWDNLQNYTHYALRSARRLRIRTAAASRELTARTFATHYVLRIHTILILVWIWLLYWGEVRVFEKETRECAWHKWEKWEKGATPHHVAFIADPQLIDPHTYPGRPWPLNDLTIAFTDKYLKRSYFEIQRAFDPDTIYFLGDLFDGGREWATGKPAFHASEKQWKRYGPKYWRDEFERFGRIFLRDSQVTGGRPERAEKNIIASLPGNHDLGFSTGVQASVRDRFQAYFGKGDRVDVIGNHTFIGLDTVSLSAMDVHGSDPNLWSPGMEFLDNIKDNKRAAVEHFLGGAPDYPRGWKFFHQVTKKLVQGMLVRPEDDNYADQQKNDLPTVLLTHVPFYREPGTPCGWQREKYPPTVPQMASDERNAIRVASGYQYQNVLSKALTKTIAERVGNIQYVFSGDDHDYCEVVHRAYPSGGGGIWEVTVKSLSWAMGVRQPGFQLVSLWNPVDGHAMPLAGSPQAVRMPTLRSHMCLLPDQLAIFIQYAFCFALTTFILLIHSAVMTIRERNRSVWTPIDSVLPLTEPAAHPKKDKVRSSPDSGAHGFADSKPRSEDVGFSASRTDSAARARSGKDLGSNGSAIGHYGLPPAMDLQGDPLIGKAGYHGKRKDEDAWIDELDFEMKPAQKRRRTFAMHFLVSFKSDMLWVAVPAFAWFFWLWRMY